MSSGRAFGPAEGAFAAAGGWEPNIPGGGGGPGIGRSGAPGGGLGARIGGGAMFAGIPTPNTAKLS